MPRPARATVLATAILLAACSTPAAPAVDPHGGHVAGSGTAGTPHPSAPEGADGSIELESEFVLGGTGVSTTEALEIEHRGWERLGVEGQSWRDRNMGGWSTLLPHFIQAAEDRAASH